MSKRQRQLIWILRAIGLIDLVAILAVVAPRAWISYSHQLIGLGEFPNEPIAGYLARCTSVWYASYGLLFWFVSFDVQKYSLLITCLAWAMIIQGIVFVGIDIAENMPTWWILFEGPCCSVLGAGVLWLQRAAIATAE